MPWKCPACETAIRHEEDAPRPGRVYRCHICRLELVFDDEIDKLTVAPMPGDRASDKPPRRKRP